MNDLGEKVKKTQDLSTKITRLHQDRIKAAQERFNDRVKKAYDDHVASLMSKPLTPWDLWTNWIQYTTDFTQRSVLFWDTIRRRGNNFIEHERAGKPPVLHFQYETVLDARKFNRPVNYALLKIQPPAGITIDTKRRPYVVIDPRAGHGPGVGGFKDDSQVGVALREGHPVYFVTFYPEPEPGQTLYDVCVAEQTFVRKVRELHPDSPKPVIVGNCQGGWATMMLAAAAPEDVGPIVINGAPMAYWSGAWHEGERPNPNRYANGLLGGSWISSFTADLGNGAADGAYLVQNFEYLDPANSFWDKYYHLFDNVDTEPDRFLHFERWWSGFFSIGKRELDWMIQELFVGNKFWSEHERGTCAAGFDLRDIKSPIILFASMGDNITPPEQAFNWVADTYGSTEEIKARGQVIVGLLHKSIGHLGIFVSGRVAKKEHKEIVSVLKSIEALPPGLYAMNIIEKQVNGKVDYEVEFIEHRLEDIVEGIPLKRIDEKPFQAAAEISAHNQRAYELFAEPLVQFLSNAYTARLGQLFHPMRVQRWIYSDLNPWMWWLKPAAEYVKAQRQPATKDQPFSHVERFISELISASLDYHRDLRDANNEAVFFQTYGTIYLLTAADAEMPAGGKSGGEQYKLAALQEALASITKGGYAEALSRAGHLLSPKDRPHPLAELEFLGELEEKYPDLMLDLPPYERRLIVGKQDLICRYDPEKALATLPQLVSDPADRRRFITLLDAVMDDSQARSKDLRIAAEQTAMLKRIREVVSGGKITAAAGKKL